MINLNCEICGKIFKLKSDLIRHENRKNPCTTTIKSIYICNICNYTTNNKQNFIRHQNKLKPCIRKQEATNNDILEKLELMAKNDKLREEKHQTEIQILKQKIEKQKRPINYNFIVNTFTNATNIEDCLSMEHITKEIMEKCKNLPLKDGSTYVLNTLCDIDPQLRPFHCTDTSRQNFLVRSNDAWNVDSKGTTINDHLTPVLSNLYTDIYKEKMQNKDVSIDERIDLMDKMSKELVSENILKCSDRSIKMSSTKYAVKNIDNILNTDIDTLTV